MEQIDQDHLLERAGNVGQRNVVQPAAAEQDSLFLARAARHCPANEVAAAAAVRLPGVAPAMVAAVDAQQFTEVAHLAEVARAGGQQALQPLQEHRAVSIAGSAPLRYAQLESEETTMTARTIKLALVQMRCDGTSRDNLARALARVGEAAAAGASVVVLPE